MKTIHALLIATAFVFSSFITSAQTPQAAPAEIVPPEKEAMKKEDKRDVTEVQPIAPQAPNDSYGYDYGYDDGRRSNAPINLSNSPGATVNVGNNFKGAAKFGQQQDSMPDEIEIFSGYRTSVKPEINKWLKANKGKVSNVVFLAPTVVGDTVTIVITFKRLETPTEAR